MLLLYSSLMLAALVVGAPYWLARIAVSGRYRAGLGERLGRVPERLRRATAGREVIWLHAVSVGEVMAATRLVRELETALPECVVVVSTTTLTGQRVARERFGAERVFFYPLDLTWAVTSYLRVLRPKLLVLMESELWPRMLTECEKSGVPVAVVNARVSDRSFRRGIRVRMVWQRVLRQVSLFAAQSAEDARRLKAMGARTESIGVAGNLKYDVPMPARSRIAERLRTMAAGRPVIVAGSTVARKSDQSLSEEEIVIQAWERKPRQEIGAMLVLAPRHPERFAEVEKAASRFRLVTVNKMMQSGLADAKEATPSVAYTEEIFDEASRISGDTPSTGELAEIVLLDTIGDLAAVYGIADVAFVGGSLVARGGHNPLEPAQFGVPVVMGTSYENFRDVVGGMHAMDGIRIVEDRNVLSQAIMELLRDPAAAHLLGERGRAAFEAQAGATGRTVAMLTSLLTVKQ